MTQRTKKVFDEKLSWSDKIAQRIADFTGNIRFVWIHTTLFITWIVMNFLLGESAWDPYPFIFLTLVVSLEAIFLATFVLMAQNRESRENEIRDQLDYEVDTRSEQEIQQIKKMLRQVLEEVQNNKRGSLNK